MLPVAVPLVFMAGWASQRGSTCAVSAVEELVIDRRAGRLAGFLLCAALAFTLYALARASGIPVTMRVPGAPVSATGMMAGAAFGLGAWINGRCAMGTVARLCSGDCARAGTIGGFLAGAFLAARAGLLPQMGMIESVEAQIDPALAAGLGVALTLALVWLTLQTSKERPGEWSPARAMLVIGTISGVLLLIARGWPYTGVLVRLASGQPVAMHAALLIGTFLIGAITAALTSGNFSATRGTPGDWLRSICGGALMGFAATILPGGNDTMLVTGLPLLLPHLVSAYLTMLLALALLIIARRGFTA